MTKNSDDLRVRRTRALLQKALIELTTEKGFSDVTVRDITERAMVNRSTFYHHYLDKYDLLNQYIEEAMMVIDDQAGASSSMIDPAQPSPGMIRMLEHVRANADFYRALLGNKGDPALCAQSFRRFLQQQFRQMQPGEHVEANSGKPPTDLGVSYIVHASMGAILWWLEQDEPCSPEQVATWLNQFGQADMYVSLGLKRLRDES